MSSTGSSPITQTSTLPSLFSFPGPPTRNKLRSPRSISTLTDSHRVYNGSSSNLAASPSNLTLTQRSRAPSQLGLYAMSAASGSASNISGTLSPPSLLNVKQKTGKPGFFNRLFAFGKSKRKEQPSTQDHFRVGTPTPSTRPVSTISTNSFVSTTTSRKRAVLVKKQPATYPTKHNGSLSNLIHSGRQSSHQNIGHIGHNSEPQPTYPQVGDPLMDVISKYQPTSYPPNHATLSNYPSHFDPTRTPTATSPAKALGPTRGNINLPRGAYQPQGPTASNHTQYGMVQYHGPHPGFPSAQYSGVQDSKSQPLGTTPGPTLCTVCNVNPPYTEKDTGKTLAYCSDACRTVATVATPQTQQATCSYPGCTHPAVMYPPDHHWNYCSESHESYARKGCISCRKADDSGTQLCKRCRETSRQRAPMIIPVPMDHDAFWHVVDKFSESWPNPTQCPIFQAARVFKVISTKERRDTYLGYRDTLEYYGRFTAKGRPEGNERILWHGARRSCNLGERGQNSPCTIPRCTLCSVIRGSSNGGEAPTDTSVGTGRFGAGIYTFTKAMKADDHCSNDKNVETPWVGLLLSKVATGHECVMRHDNTKLTAAPQGYDSVIGEVRGRLNYEELVVYTNDAVRPTWLVMYQRT